MEQVPYRQVEAEALETFNCLIYIYFSFHFEAEGRWHAGVNNNAQGCRKYR